MPDDTGKITLGWLKLENVPHWVLVLVLLGVGLGAGVLVWRVQIHDPEFALISQKEANRALQAAVNEYGLHIAEPPETSAVLLDDIRGRLTAQRYGDGCVVIARSRNGRVRSKLIPDLDRDEHPTAQHLPARPSFVVSVLASGGRCLNPHGGRFATWYGERRGDWVEVWRRWPDGNPGCTHVQMYDVVHNYWDVNQDGTPKVRWVTCVH